MTNPKSSVRHQAGFTLIELMVVLAIIAIVAAIAAPDYRSSIEASRATSAANHLLGTLQFARSEAVAKRTRVTLCSSSNGSACGGTWANGAIVLTQAGEVLRSLPSNSDVSVSGDSITFKNDGTTTATDLTISSGSHASKTISINIAGYAKIN